MADFKENIGDNILLDKKVEYSCMYDRSILRRELRSRNREQYGILENNLPFLGYDVWNCYEFSTLTVKNQPVTAVLKLKYPCTNPYIVESKSLKLYLNSFNMSQFGSTRSECFYLTSNIIEKDLSELLETSVSIRFFEESEESEKSCKGELDQRCTDISSLINLDTIDFKIFNEDPSILKVCDPGVRGRDTKPPVHRLSIKTNLMRSNCKITHQPDWGDLFIEITVKDNNIVDLESLIKYIVSFRKENHFHEEVVEMIYKRLYDLLAPEELLVAALYTRRGGIDINPIRVNKEELLDGLNLLDMSLRHTKTLRQ